MSKLKISLGDDLLKELKKKEDVIKDKEAKLARSNQSNLSSSSEPFIPEINDDDNILVKTVKEILIDKKISLKELEFKNVQEESNFKRSLRINTKMSVERFSRWMELLGVDWKIVYDYEFKNNK